MYVKQPYATVPVPNIRLTAFERVYIESKASMEINLIIPFAHHAAVYNSTNGTNWYKPNVVVEKGNIFWGVCFFLFQLSWFIVCVCVCVCVSYLFVYLHPYI